METVKTTSEKLANGSVVVKDQSGKVVQLLTGVDAANYKDTGSTQVKSFVENQAQHNTQSVAEGIKVLDKTSANVAANNFAPDVLGNIETNQDATAVINSEQDADISKGVAESEVPTKKTTEDYIKEIKTATTPTGGAPVVKSNVETYNQMRTDQGITSLEDQLNALKADQETLLANKRARVTSEKGKTVAMNVISGRISQAEQQENERIDAINRSINSITNQLNTKYNTISTLMSLTQLDNTAATEKYDKELANNLAIYNAAKGLEDADKTEAERNADNARANAQIVINTMAENGTTYDQLSSDQQLSLTKLGTESGLGATFFSNLLKAGNNKQILTTITSADDTKATIIYKDGTTKVIKTGLPAKSTGGSPTDSDQKIYYKQTMANALKSVTGADGYISQENWAKARQEWATNSPFTAEDFDNAFRGYVNPAYAGTYAGFEGYEAGFKKPTSGVSALVDALNSK